MQSRGSEAEAVADADLVLSVNSSHDAMTALENALPALRTGTLWADLNTASPGLKVALAERAKEYGVPVVDVALMSPVPGKGLRTPMLVSGEEADRYASLLAGLGADVDVQPGPVGTAISRKLLRSVFYKGLAAAVVEALRGAEAAGCADWLRETSPRSWRASTRERSTGWSRARTRTPAAGPTRWRPPPSSSRNWASRPASPPPPATCSWSCATRSRIPDEEAVALPVDQIVSGTRRCAIATSNSAVSTTSMPIAGANSSRNSRAPSPACSRCARLS